MTGVVMKTIISLVFKSNECTVTTDVSDIVFEWNIEQDSSPAESLGVTNYQREKRNLP